MRRKDREITDTADIKKIIEKCDVCRLAFNRNGAPYVVPLNFGCDFSGSLPVFYFHCAGTGLKLDLLRKDCRAGFEFDCGHRLVRAEKACGCTMEYESVLGWGYAEIVGDTEKEDALRRIMSQYFPDGGFVFESGQLKIVACLRLRAAEITGKRLQYPPSGQS